jgi:molecular chaperone DnaK
VCSGESRRFEENDLLGELTLEGLRAAQRGQTRIEVTFQIDTDGMLHVRARDPDTGNEQKATMNVKGSMSEAEIAKAASAVAKASSGDSLPAAVDKAGVDPHGN